MLVICQIGGLSAASFDPAWRTNSGIMAVLIIPRFPSLIISIMHSAAYSPLGWESISNDEIHCDCAPARCPVPACT